MPRSRALILLALATTIALAGCSGARRDAGQASWKQRGRASWYGPGFQGKKTANGETYDMEAMTAAHKELPFNTVVEVRNLDNGQKTTVRINDRGPFVRGRIIDLSRAAARAIDMLGPGTARVEIRAQPGQLARGPADFTVQVGAFRDRGHAKNLAASLRHDYQATIVENDGWHRVQVGGRRDRRAAKKLAATLRRQGLHALVVGVG